MGYEPCNMDPDVWLKDCGENYEHIAVYADDLLIASKDPQCVVDILTNTHHFKLKDTGPMSYHLGCDFGRDIDGTLLFTPMECIGKMEECHYIMFISKPKQLYMLSLVKVDHPELDASKHLDQDRI